MFKIRELYVHRFRYVDEPHENQNVRRKFSFYKSLPIAYLFYCERNLIAPHLISSLSFSFSPISFYLCFVYFYTKKVAEILLFVGVRSARFYLNFSFGQLNEIYGVTHTNSRDMLCRLSELKKLQMSHSNGEMAHMLQRSKFKEALYTVNSIVTFRRC